MTRLPCEWPEWVTTMRLESAHALVVLSLLATLCTGGCSRELPSSDEGLRGATYDPYSDPLVNPRKLFETDPADHPEREEQDATLLRRLLLTPTTLNPVFNGVWEDHYLTSLLFRGIFIRDREMNMVPSPSVVEEYRESQDHRIVTVKLTDQLTWHDGEPWTAYDVEFSWRMITSETVPALSWKMTASELEDVRALDTYTVEYVHGDALGTRMMNMAFPVVPRHIFDNPTERARDPTMRESAYFIHYARDEVVGSGPYRLVEWRSQDRIVVERWEDSPLRKAHFKRQILKIQPDPNVALLLFKSGELHEMQLTPLQFATQTNDASFERVGVKGLGLHRLSAFLGWNVDGSNPFFADVRVRKAMAHAIDIPRLVHRVTLGLLSQSRGIFDAEHWAFAADIELLAHNPERAASLLASAGWTIDPGDGWRYKEIHGERWRFEFEMQAGVSPTSSKIADLMAEDLKRIGISMVPRFLESATFLERLYNHEFQAYFGIDEVTTDPDLWRLRFDTEGYEEGLNFGGYSHPQVDELFELGRREPDRATRSAYYGEIQRILYEDQAHLFLWDSRLLWAFHKNLRGVSFSPAGPFLFYPGLTDWWFARER